MTSSFTKPVSVLLLDIEGTTTPIDFVYNILFPYARAHLKPYLEEHRSSSELLHDITELIRENSADVLSGFDPPLISEPAEQASSDDVVAYLKWLMDRDRKSTPLKSLQGRIWEEGYRKGELRSQVFEDVPRAFKRWHNQQKDICIYSSGSVLAQKLLFGNTDAGDLANHISHYFDTNIGAKHDASSYIRIVEALKRRPSEIVFVSDRMIELDAAASAGLEVLLCVRSGNEPQNPPPTCALVSSFDDVLP